MDGGKTRRDKGSFWGKNDLKIKIRFFILGEKIGIYREGDRGKGKGEKTRQENNGQDETLRDRDVRGEMGKFFVK